MPAAQGWQLEQDSAAAYEQYLVPPIMGPWAKRLVQEARVEQGQRVLDVACGTGIVARTAAAIAGPGKVEGVDLDPGMLAAAQRTAQAQGMDIAFRQGDAAKLPQRASSFEVVLCQQALQFFPDKAQALREAHRVLAPGGRLGVGVLRSLDHQPLYAALAEALERHAGPEAGAMMRSPFAPLEQGDLRDLAKGAGFREVRVLLDAGSYRYPSPSEMVRREASSSPLAGPLASLPPAKREALVKDFAAAVADHVDDEGVVVPYENHVLTATR
jgi:ubiquinone/menaquinone biosynthesis C-methylase UbiE